jgi:hypothetical protein
MTIQVFDLLGSQTSILLFYCMLIDDYVSPIPVNKDAARQSVLDPDSTWYKSKTIDGYFDKNNLRILSY